MTTKPKNHKLVKKIGLRLSILRDNRGFTQSKFAEYVQIPLEDLEQYETGSKAMTIDDLATISSALDIGAFHFFL
jgi:transcriptional regulator with XRE-family HTH domain